MQLKFIFRCVLTPSYFYLAKNIFTTLEKSIGGPTNEAVLEWIQDLDVGPSGPNIIMTDFVEYNHWKIPRSIIHRNYATLNLNMY